MVCEKSHKLSIKDCTTRATFRDIALAWYMNYKVNALVGQVRPLMEIKRDLLREFQKHKLESHCITEIKEIK